MNLFPENIDGQRIKTDVKGVGVIQSFLSHIQINAKDTTAGNNIGILAATALTAQAQVITENISNPNIPRNIRMVGNVAGITGNVVIKGTNYQDDPITETVALNGTTVVEGIKAFKAVTEIDLPIQVAADNTVSLGFGEKLGLPYLLNFNTVRLTALNNVPETAAPTVTTSASAIENNTIKLNSALNGNTVDIYLIVN